MTTSFPKYLCLLAFVLPLGLHAAPRAISLTQSAPQVQAYDFVEITLHVEGPDAANPFTDVSVRGVLSRQGGPPLEVDGFCDSPDGSVFRIRFMPTLLGDYSYSISYRQGEFEKQFQGTIKAVDGHRRGVIRADSKFPWHFIWEGTGEHYFFNGTTAFWLMGWRDERVIQYSIERLSKLKINRIRVLLAGDMDNVIGEPVMTGRNFTMALRPWPATAPESFDRPGIDYTRFDVAYWQRWERMLRFARDRDVIISVVQDISTHKAQPVAWSDDERRYLRYAVARLASFSNITWDLGDDMNISAMKNGPTRPGC